jgi:hypothetical protein
MNIINFKLNSFTLKVYRKLLKNIRVPSKYISLLSQKEQAPFTYVTLCGEHHVDMLQESLLSVISSWNKIPTFHIYSDGSMSCEAVREKFSWLGINLKVSPWEDSLNTFDPITEEKVIEFARKHVMGKKFAIILSSGRSGASFWCDSDVLWYKNLSLENELTNNQSFTITASADYQPSYSKNLTKIYPQLLQSPYVCAGIVFLSGDMMKNADLSDMLTESIAAPDHFSEQTMVARVVIENGVNIWSKDEIACYEHDKDSVFSPTYNGKNWSARHYVSPVRHLFWRDAFYSRLFKK